MFSNRQKRKGLLLYFFALVLSCFSVLVIPKPTASQELLASHKQGELLIKLRSSDEIYKFKFSDKDDLSNLIKFYQGQKEVDYVEPNYLYQATLEPLDTFYTQQIYLTQIKANLAWNITTGTNNVTIGIIDSGVDIDHPDLKNNIWVNIREIPGNGIDDDENGFTDDVHGWDFVNNVADPKPKLIEPYTAIGINHGTVVAGVAAAQGGNNEGIAGIAWHAKIMPLRVLDGLGAGDTLTVAHAIDYARQMGANIINLSFVGEGRSLTLEEAIKKASEAGIILVAAAGNEVKEGINMDDLPEYPVCHNGPNGENWVLGVGAVDKNDLKASFSNYGKNCLDISAPGVTVFSSTYHQSGQNEFNDYYKSGWTGTSVSTPQVAGAAALIKSLKPELSVSQIKDLLLNYTDNIDLLNKNYSGLLGKGRLNVYASLSRAISVSRVESNEIHQIVTAPAFNGGPQVRFFKKNLLEAQFMANDEKFKSGLSLAAADINNDGTPEVIMGLGKGTYPWVKVFTKSGILKEKFAAYAENFRGGLEVALGDVDNNGNLEIVTAPGPGGGPHIRIFSTTGQLKGQFFAFDKKERTGLELTLTDVNNDGQEEIVVTRKSGLPEVKIFQNNGQLLQTFLAYDKSFRGGIHLAASDLDGDGQTEIITGTGTGGGPHIRVFNKNGHLKSQFFAYEQRFRGGVYVAAGDVDADGTSEIITGAGPTGGPQVRVFDIKGNVKFQFFTYDERFKGGVRVAIER